MVNHRKDFTHGLCVYPSLTSHLLFKTFLGQLDQDRQMRLLRGIHRNQSMAQSTSNVNVTLGGMQG